MAAPPSAYKDRQFLAVIGDEVSECVALSPPKLAKQSYEKPELLYKYHNVPIPPLGMVDDILTMTDASTTAMVSPTKCID